MVIAELSGSDYNTKEMGGSDTCPMGSSLLAHGDDVDTPGRQMKRSAGVIRLGRHRARIRAGPMALESGEMTLFMASA